MNTCKNCIFWKDGVCDGIEFDFPEKNENVWDKPRKMKGISICIDMDDDSGLNSRIHTDSDFSCGNFEPREL